VVHARPQLSRDPLCGERILSRRILARGSESSKGFKIELCHARAATLAGVVPSPSALSAYLRGRVASRIPDRRSVPVGYTAPHNKALQRTAAVGGVRWLRAGSRRSGLDTRRLPVDTPAIHGRPPLSAGPLCGERILSRRIVARRSGSSWVQEQPR